MRQITIYRMKYNESDYLSIEDISHQPTSISYTEQGNEQQASF